MPFKSWRVMGADQCSRIAVLYTGGTVGMKDTPRGFAPAAGHLSASLLSLPMFHDLAFGDPRRRRGDSDEDFSDGKQEGSKDDAGEGEEEGGGGDDDGEKKESYWSKRRARGGGGGEGDSGGSSVEVEISVDLAEERDVDLLPSAGAADGGARNDGREQLDTSLDTAEVLDRASLTRSSGPVFELQRVPAEFDFVTPASKLGKRGVYRIFEYTPLLDSCNMGIQDWARIARDIERLYADFDAFVVLHGTDTMSYTASALSFMLGNLGKTVVITGSQVPIGVPLSDALDNLLGALTIAIHYEIPEVVLYFAGKGFRGNRTTKVDSDSFEGFGSANYGPLLEHRVTGFKVHWHRMVPPPNGDLLVRTSFNPYVAVFRLFPGFSVESLANALKRPTAGLVLQTFGAGNAPDTNKAMLTTLKKATKRGVVIVNITQCIRGGVAAHYATGSALLEVGVVPGYDMTVEAALTKLGFLLALRHSPTEVRRRMVRSICGEMKGESDTAKRFSFRDAKFVTTVYKALHTDTAEGTESKNGPEAASAESEQLEIAQALTPVLFLSAAGHGNIKAVESMILDKCDVNVTDYNGRTALHLAAAQKHADVVLLLLDHGANPNSLDHRGESPLCHAILRADHKPTADLIFRRGGKLLLDGDLATPLLQCAEAGNLGKLKRLISVGVSPNLRNFDARTCAHVAAIRGDLRMLEFLKEVGANLLAQDRWGHRPEQDARDENPFDEDLLQFFADLKDYKPRTDSPGIMSPVAARAAPSPVVVSPMVWNTSATSLAESPGSPLAASPLGQLSLSAPEKERF